MGFGEVSCTRASPWKERSGAGCGPRVADSPLRSWSNSTLDDASSAVTYTGWTSTSFASSSIGAISSGTFYQGTVSYTSSAGASAAFSFTGELGGLALSSRTVRVHCRSSAAPPGRSGIRQHPFALYDHAHCTSTVHTVCLTHSVGSALYVFGCTGPSFGTFQIALDASVVGTYNASTTTDSYDTLLFFVSGLNEASHSVSITNQVDGGLLALDFFVAASSSSSSSASTTTASGAITASTGTGTATGTAATAVFSSGSSGTSSEGGGTGSAGAVAGGILGALGGLVSGDTCAPTSTVHSRIVTAEPGSQLLLYFAYRYYLYRKAGGEGGFFTSLCGPPRKPPQKAGPAKNEFKIWPMVRSRPKYMT